MRLRRRFSRDVMFVIYYGLQCFQSEANYETSKFFNGFIATYI